MSKTKFEIAYVDYDQKKMVKIKGVDVEAQLEKLNWLLNICSIK